MREILFRGKRIDNGEWVEGNLYREESKTTFGDGEYSSSYITEICDVDIRTFLSGGSFFIDNEFIQVSDETVGQYTGLKDKNGKKIFEGDIVKCVKYYDEMFKVTFTGEVVYRSASFCVKESRDDYLYHFRWDDYSVEVIGNIYDNPELLKEV